MMTEAWRPFSDEEMRKIIEGERMAVNGWKDDLSSTLAAKQGIGTRVFRGRPFKRSLNGSQRVSKENGSDTCTQTHSDKKLNSKTSIAIRIPKIPEEKEEEDEGCDLVEPVLRCDSVELQHRTSDLSLDEPVSNRPANNIDVICLEEFQEKQKAMEEQNRMSKELLQKALTDRAKKTREEAEKLNHIEEELKKLDNMLTNDVTIIRNQIEIASQEYLEAQKRYDRAEREYISAKMNLYTYKEKKELLTSHLCTIIEKNELRKAQKLSHLMSKLEMGMDISTLTLDDSDLKSSEDTSIMSSPT